MIGLSKVLTLTWTAYRNSDNLQRSRGCSGQAFRLLASVQGEPGSIPSRATPGFSHVGIVPDDAAGRRVYSGISPPQLSFISGAAQYTHLNHSSSALETSRVKGPHKYLFTRSFKVGHSYLMCPLPATSSMMLHEPVPSVAARSGRAGIILITGQLRHRVPPSPNHSRLHQQPRHKADPLETTAPQYDPPISRLCVEVKQRLVQKNLAALASKMASLASDVSERSTPISVLEWSGEWTGLGGEYEAAAQECENGGIREIPEKNLPTSDIVRHDCQAVSVNVHLELGYSRVPGAKSRSGKDATSSSPRGAPPFHVPLPRLENGGGGACKLAASASDVITVISGAPPAAAAPNWGRPETQGHFWAERPVSSS
ncbi:hypothetical protein PR048_023048 [Dryococelus australis]|uniref:Uncharacterized protein n=1 Tax=Dryococelus australis TaxID=614101 RepID=A0ABQ9GSZ8_9NEOP|nr:hypothetical protein PR048_023048 [Dryococelus australis]